MPLVWSALSVWLLILAVLMFDGIPDWTVAAVLFESIRLGRKVLREDESDWGLVKLGLNRDE